MRPCQGRVGSSILPGRTNEKAPYGVFLICAARVLCLRTVREESNGGAMCEQHTKCEHERAASSVLMSVSKLEKAGRFHDRTVIEKTGHLVRFFLYV